MQSGQQPKTELLSTFLRHCPQKGNCSSMASSSSLSFTSSSLHIVGATTDVLGACERLVVMVVVLVMEELTLDMLDTTDSVEHTAGAEKGRKAAPLGSGRGRVGLAAAPTVWPSPGNLLAEAATVVGAAAESAVAWPGLAAKAADLAPW